MRMIHSSEFEGLSISDQYFSLARGYLEGSRVLCEAMLNDNFAQRYSHTRVIIHLCRHAIELFFKGAISEVTKSQPPNTHNLANLLIEYERAIPDKKFHFKVPFCVESFNDLNLELFPEWKTLMGEKLETLIDEHNKTLDQRYRYPTDLKGKPFSSPEGFIPQSYLSELDRLSKVFLQVELQLQSYLE